MKQQVEKSNKNVRLRPESGVNLLKAKLASKLACQPARCLLPVEIIDRCGLATVELLPYILPY